MPADRLLGRDAAELSLREIGIRDRIGDDHLERLVPWHQGQEVCGKHVDHVHLHLRSEGAILNLPRRGCRRCPAALVEECIAPRPELRCRQIDAGVRRDIVHRHAGHPQVLERRTDGTESRRRAAGYRCRFRADRIGSDLPTKDVQVGHFCNARVGCLGRCVGDCAFAGSDNHISSDDIAAGDGIRDGQQPVFLPGRAHTVLTCGDSNKGVGRPERGDENAKRTLSGVGELRTVPE